MIHVTASYIIMMALRAHTIIIIFPLYCACMLSRTKFNSVCYYSYNNDIQFLVNLYLASP